MRKNLCLAVLLACTVTIPTPASSDDDAGPRLRGATGWLNSPPLTTTELRGKVVLVDFWTYTCINWLRTLPYIRAWDEKYRDHGLVVIGVHTPEFGFERDLANVRAAAEAMGITYPVAIDNDHTVWRAFRNNAWPALYFIDAQGRVRYRHIGEGRYEDAERTIQLLLAESASDPVTADLVAVNSQDVEAAANSLALKSPETYLGYDRTANFASRGGARLNARRTYAIPERLTLNHWALSGAWTIGNESVELNEHDGRIVYRFGARDLHLVMGAASKGGAVQFRVLIDGQPPGVAHGSDVDDQGNGTVTEHRLYQLIRQPSPVTERLFEIEFFEPGVAAYAFTFG